MPNKTRYAIENALRSGIANMLLIYAVLITIPDHAKAQLDNGSLFQSEVPLELTLTGDVSSLFADRIATEATYFDFILSHGEPEMGEEITMRVKTRGNFRR
ncbi:MAG: hypothetical protein HKN76_03035, partial [Saprospiraceae bacterium]|nr:hypothetical protein [Saprospiraceae bacterium]